MRDSLMIFSVAEFSQRANGGEPGCFALRSLRLTSGPWKDSQNLALFLFRFAGRAVAGSFDEEVLLDLQQGQHRFVVVFGNLDECVVAQGLQIFFMSFRRTFGESS